MQMRLEGSDSVDDLPESSVKKIGQVVAEKETSEQMASREERFRCER